MSPIKYLFACLAFAVVAGATYTPAALAQGTNVVVIDEGLLLRDSKAGKDMQVKLQSIETQIKNELEPTRSSLEAEGKSLQTRAQGKTQQVIAADAALVAELQAYQTKANGFAQRRQTLSQELALTERTALVAFNKALEPVLMELVREENAGVVLSRGQVVYASDATDVTRDLITKLDVAVPTVSVVRQRAPAQPTQ